MGACFGDRKPIISRKSTRITEHDRGVSNLTNHLMAKTKSNNSEENNINQEVVVKKKSLTKRRYSKTSSNNKSKDQSNNNSILIAAEVKVTPQTKVKKQSNGIISSHSVVSSHIQKFDITNKTDKNKINLILLGDTCVGKSQLAIKFTKNKIEPFYITSISLEEYTKVCTFSDNKYELIFNIIPGDKSYQHDYSTLYGLGDFFLVLYDVTSKRSYDRAVEIINTDILKYIKFLGGTKPNVLLLGNKVDMKERQVDPLTVDKFCADNSYIHFETSVFTNFNLYKVMNKVMELYTDEFLKTIVV
jgi:GTPase SAR1 family protein